MAGPDEWVDDEWVDDAAWVDDSPAQLAPAGKPVDYGKYTEPGQLPKAGPTAWQQYRTGQQPQPEMQSMSQSGLEGATLAERVNANLGAVPDDFNPVNALKATYGIAQPILAEGKKALDPYVTRAQTAIRESGFAKPVTDPALLLGGRPAETLAQNAMSLFIGSPNQYQTTQEMEQRAVEVADSPLAAGLGKAAVAVGAGVPGAIAAPFMGDMTAAGLAYEGTKEAAYLPLYLIDARESAGAVERAVVGGGLSEVLDPRPGADAARGVVTTGALGAGISAVAKLGGEALKAVQAAQWLKRQNLAGEVVGRAASPMELAVTPISEFKLIADAPATPARAGKRPSVFLLKPDDGGVLVAEKISIAKDGAKSAAIVPLEQTPLQKAYTEAVSKAGGPMAATGPVTGPAKGRPGRKKLPVLVDEAHLDMVPPELRAQVTVFSRYDKSLPETGLVGDMTNAPTEITPMRGGETQSFVEEYEHLPLNRLPDDDVMMSWVDGGERQFQVLTKREMQLLSLKNRINNIVGINTPDGVRWAEIPAIAGQDAVKASTNAKKTIKGEEIYVQPLDPAEKLGPTISEGLVLPRESLFQPNDGDLNRLLDLREETIRAERLDAADASQAESAAIAAQANPAVVFDSSSGPKIAVAATQGVPGPQAMPPGPPLANAPTPPTPILANGNGGILPPGGGGPPGGPGNPGAGAPMGPGGPITPQALAPPPPTGNFAGRGAQALKEAGLGVVDLFINPAARGARGPATSDPKLMLLAAEAAGAAQAGQAIDSLLPRMLDSVKRRVAPWVDALPPASKAQFLRDVDATLQSRGMTVANLKQKWPQLAAGIEQELVDFKAREYKNSLILDQPVTPQGESWMGAKSFTAPEGMDKLAKDLIDDEAYVARLYLAPLAGRGEMKKLLEKDAVLHAEILNDIAADIIKRKHPVGTQPSTVMNEAMLELERYLGNPEEVLAKRPGQGGANKQGAAGLRDRRAGNLEVQAKVYAQWSKANPTAVKPSMRFVKGVIDEAGLARELNAVGVTLPPKDIKFLTEMRSELSEVLKPWEKKALRLVQDPFTKAAFSVVRQESLLVQKAATDAAREAGFIRSFQELEAAGINPVLEGWKEVPLDKSRFGPWAGKTGPERNFIHPEAWDGLNAIPDWVRGMNALSAAMTDSPNALVRGGANAHFAAKTAYTVYSPSAWLSNITGNSWGVVKSGVTPVDLFTKGGWGDAVRQWREFTARPNEVSIRGGDITGADWMREGMKYGTVGTDAFSEEMAPMMKKLLHKDVFGQVSGVHGFADLRNSLLKMGVKPKEAYAAIDSVFRHGTWLTLLKKSGVDISNGKLVDRAAADYMLNGGRFRLMNSATAMDISAMSDEAVVDALKSAMAWRIRRGFGVPGQPGVATRAVAGAANLSLGTTGNMFARTAMEEVRSDMMTPWRALTEPGVAGALLGWGAVAGAVGLGLNHLRRASGITDEDAKTSVQGLPQGLRAYSSALEGVWRWDTEGRVVALDYGRFFQPLRYTGGDALARPLMDQAGANPGQLGARTAYNILVGSAFGGSTVGENVIDPMARTAGLDLAQRYTPANVEEGPFAAASKIAKYLAPGLGSQLLTAASRANDPRNAGAGEFLKPLTAGTLIVGGTPQQAGKNAANRANYGEAEPERQRAIRAAMQRTEDPAEREQFRQQLMQLQQQKGQTQRYQQENP